MKLKDLYVKINDIDEYINFREMVKKNMKDPLWLGDFSKEDLIDMKNNNSIIWIYYLDDNPVCSMMLIPSKKEDLEKFEIDLDYKETVDYGPMFVNPKYIGNNLQYQMLEELDKYSSNLGYKYGVTTVHPDNIYSINNILKNNFILVEKKEFARGVRNIYLKCLDDNYNQKILSFIVKDDKYLLLKGSNLDPQFFESFWYVVTGSTEKEDKSLIDTVKREIKEETNLKVLETKRLYKIFKYDSLGKKCIEHIFISKVNDFNVLLNEESIDYKWCKFEEFINLIKWHYDKKELIDMLK